MPNIASIFGTNKTAIEERLGNSIEAFWQAADPIVRDTIVSSQEVQPASADSRDYVVHLLYENRYAGVVEPIQAREDFSLFGDPTDTLWGEKIARRTLKHTWPDPFEGPNPVPYRLSVPMRGFDVALGLTMAEMRMEATNATAVKTIAGKMAGLANNVARRFCAYWHADQADNFRLSSLGPATGSGAYVISDPDKTITFYPPEEVTYRYHVGDMVDIVRTMSTTIGGDTRNRVVRLNDRHNNVSSAANAGSALAAQVAGGVGSSSTRVRGFVIAVSPMENKVVLKFDTTAVDGTATAFTDWANTSDLASDAYVVFHNTHIGAHTGAANATNFEAPAGWHSWLKTGRGGADNFLLGNEAVETSGLGGKIDVTKHPEFLSFYKNVGGPLTEHSLGLYLDRFAEAKEDDGQYLDTLVSTRGVMRAFQVERIDRERIDRTGRLPSLAATGAPGEWYYTHEGRKYLIYLSKWLKAGTMIGFRRGGGNWKRFVPPRPAGLRRKDGVEPFVPLELVAPLLTGTSSTILPKRNSNSQVQAGVEMLGVMHYQLCPTKQAAGLKLVGIQEDRVFTG